MSFFEKLYRREYSHFETIESTLPEIPFRYTDLLGGIVMGYSTQGEGKLISGQQRQILLDALNLGFYYLVANGYLTVRVEHFKRTLLDSFDFNGSRHVIERNPNLPGLDELESPLLTAIYSAADGNRSLGKIASQVLNGYLGAHTKHDRPVTVFYSALLNGEMRFWRVEREATNWGFLKHFQFSCPADHRGILEEAGVVGREALRALQTTDMKLRAVAHAFAAQFMLKLAGRKRKEYRHHHYPRRPHRKLPRRRKRRPQEPDDPRMWME